MTKATTKKRRLPAEKKKTRTESKQRPRPEGALPPYVSCHVRPDAVDSIKPKIIMEMRMMIIIIMTTRTSPKGEKESGTT